MVWTRKHNENGWAMRSRVSLEGAVRQPRSLLSFLSISTLNNRVVDVYPTLLGTPTSHKGLQFTHIIGHREIFKYHKWFELSDSCLGRFQLRIIGIYAKGHISFWVTFRIKFTRSVAKRNSVMCGLWSSDFPPKLLYFPSNSYEWKSWVVNSLMPTVSLNSRRS